MVPMWTVAPGTAFRVTVLEGAIPEKVWAGQLPALRQMTAPGAALESAFWTLAPRFSVIVQPPLLLPTAGVVTLAAVELAEVLLALSTAWTV